MIGVTNIFMSPLLNSVKMLIACRSDYLNEEDYGSVLENNIQVNFRYVVPLQYFFSFDSSSDRCSIIDLYLQKCGNKKLNNYLKWNIEKYRLQEMMKTTQIIFTIFQILISFREIDENNINLIKFYETYLEKNIENEIFRSENDAFIQKSVFWFIQIGVLLAEQMMMTEKSSNELSGEEVSRFLSNTLIKEIGEEYNSEMPLTKNHNIFKILKILGLKIQFENDLQKENIKISFPDENIKYFLLIKGLIDRFLSCGDFPEWLSQKNFIEDKTLVRFMLEAFRNTSKLIDAAEIAIFATRKSKDSNVITRAANLITFLVASNHSFYGRDLSHIKIAGANLSDGIFNACNFNYSDLSQVIFNNAKLDGASFFNTKLNNAKLDRSLIFYGLCKFAVFSPNGIYIASASPSHVDGKFAVKLWDATSGIEIKNFEHKNCVNSIAYSPNGLFIASSSDNTIRIWDVISAKEVTKFEGNGYRIKSIVYSPNGYFIACTDCDNTVRIWDIMDRKEIKKFEGHESSVNSIAFSPNGSLLVSGSDDDTVRIWDVMSAKEVKRFGNQENDTFFKCIKYYSVAFSPNGLFILSVTYCEVTLWDVISGERVKNIDEGFLFYSAAFSPDGDKIVCGSGKETVIRIFDLKTGIQIKKFEEYNAFSSVTSVAFSPDGERILSLTIDGKVRVWNITPIKVIKKFEGHESRVLKVVFLLSGDKIVSNDELTVRIWDLISGKETIIYENRHMGKAILSPNEDMILLNLGFLFYSLRNLISGKKIIKFDEEKIHNYLFSPNGYEMAMVDKFDSIQIWKVMSGKTIRHLGRYNDRSAAYSFRGRRDKNVYSIAYSSRGDKIVSGSGREKITIWNARSGKMIKVLNFKEHDDDDDEDKSSITSVVCSTNGKIGVCFGNRVRIWDLISGKEIKMFEGHNDKVNSIAFFPNGDKIVSGSKDKTVRIWELISGKEIKKFEGHQDSVSSVAVSPNGDKIASGSDDKTVRIWDAISIKNNFLNEGKETHIKHDDFNMVPFEKSNTSLIKSSYSTIFSYKNCLGYEKSFECPEFLLTLFRNNDDSLKKDN